MPVVGQQVEAVDGLLTVAQRGKQADRRQPEPAAEPAVTSPPAPPEDGKTPPWECLTPDGVQEVRKQLELQKAKDPSRETKDMVERARQSNWCPLIDDKLYVEPSTNLCHQMRQGKPGESYCSFYAVEYMASLFPGVEIRPPVCTEWQHCCVLRNS